MYLRFVMRRIKEALEDTRVILICGPRQSGKTTLAKQVVRDDMPFVSLDDRTSLRSAMEDPPGFLRGYDRLVIDEVHRVPELILAIKKSVDDDSRPGRFLLTGSANLMNLPQVADSLAGRMEIIRLLPLSQAELRGLETDFFSHAFQKNLPLPGEKVVGDDLVEMVLAGGYPEPLSRSNWRRRKTWHRSYFESIQKRDIPDIAKIDQLDLMPDLFRLLAEHSGQLTNYSALGASLGISHVTMRRYLGILENLYLIRNLRPWHANAVKRLTKTRKLHFLDSGLLAASRNLSLESLRRNRIPLGALMERFVLAELMKMSDWTGEYYSFSHYRDKDGKEVDIVVENSAGQVIGIEVKVAASVTAGDFAGLRRLAHHAGDRFVSGIVMYDNDQTVSFSDRMAAVPIACLWG